MQKEDRKVCPPGVGFVVIVVVHLLGWEDNIKGGKSVPGRCVLVYFAQHAQERGLLEMPLVFWGGTAAVQAPLLSTGVDFAWGESLLGLVGIPQGSSCWRPTFFLPRRKSIPAPSYFFHFCSPNNITRLMRSGYLYICSPPVA
jgi:hypothetical protein